MIVQKVLEIESVFRTNRNSFSETKSKTSYQKRRKE